MDGTLFRHLLVLGLGRVAAKWVEVLQALRASLPGPDRRNDRHSYAVRSCAHSRNCVVLST